MREYGVSPHLYGIHSAPAPSDSVCGVRLCAMSVTRLKPASISASAVDVPTHPAPSTAMDSSRAAMVADSKTRALADGACRPLADVARGAAAVAAWRALPVTVLPRRLRSLCVCGVWHWPPRDDSDGG